MDKTLILSRVKEVKGLTSDKQLAEFLGVTTQSLSNWKSRNTIDYDVLFTKCVGEDLNWIINGDPQVINLANGLPKIEKASQDIPLYGIEAAAGIVNLFQSMSDERPVDHLRIPGIPKSDGAMPVTGDSMYPLLKSGDIVIYKIIHDIKNAIILWGEVYILGLHLNDDDLVLVKYVQKSDRGAEWIKLVSQNQHHEPVDVPLSSVRALASVNAWIRVHKMR